MKKTILMLIVALIGGLALWSCSDDKEKSISSDVLPAQAREFVSTYYPGASIVRSTKDKDEYEVMLSEGTRIDFNKSGEWTDVDAAIGKIVPSGFYPAAIDTYIRDNMEDAGINEISKERGGYDVELITGIDLVFNSDGTFVGYD